MSFPSHSTPATDGMVDLAEAVSVPGFPPATERHLGGSVLA